ncbi:hypothetical protein KM043_012133 [Ampulex compressa]|nr:hypothetical protein KM043_012133 [Ampulex compressa]
MEPEQPNDFRPTLADSWPHIGDDQTGLCVTEQRAARSHKSKNRFDPRSEVDESAPGFRGSTWPGKSRPANSGEEKSTEGRFDERKK